VRAENEAQQFKLIYVIVSAVCSDWSFYHQD